MNIRVLWVAIALLGSPAVLHADGGAVCLSKRIGNYRITVFTSPIPVRAGPVDLSVFVQDLTSGGPVSDARVYVRARSREHPGASINQRATTEMATNKLFQAAVFDLPEPGLWDVNIFIDGLNEPIEVQFPMVANEALPRVWELAPWTCWPILAIVLFCVHKWLVARKQRQSKRIKKAGYHKGEPALVTCRPIT